jgi:hypothetical protein
VTPAFVDYVPESHTALAFGGDLGAELGIYNGVVFGGAEMDLTPLDSQKYANADETANVETHAYAHPYGGLGLYLPRPRADSALLMVGGDYGWFGPGSRGPGARLVLGFPFASHDGTWLRLQLDGYAGTQMEHWPGAGDRVWAGSVRIGFGRLL